MAIGTTLKIGFNGTAVKRGLDGMKSGMKSAAKSAAIAGAAVGAIAVGLVFAAKKAIDLGLAINKMGEEGNTANSRLTNATKVIGLFGEESGKVAERMIDLANETARMIGVDAKSIKMTQSKLMTFKDLARSADVAGGAFDRATIAAFDMASAGFGTAEANAVALGKALNDPIKGITALAKSGVTFTTQEKEKITALVKSNQLLKAQGIILSAIEGQVKDASLATADASARLGEGYRQIKESFAMGFADAFTDLPDQMDGAITAMIERVAPIGKQIGNVISDAISGDIEHLVEVAGIVGEAIGNAIKKGVSNTMITKGAGMVEHIKTLGMIPAAQFGLLKPYTKAVGFGEHANAAQQIAQQNKDDIIHDFKLAMEEVKKLGVRPAPVDDPRVVSGIMQMLSDIERNTHGETPAKF